MIDNEIGETLHPDSTITVRVSEHMKLIKENERLHEYKAASIKEGAAAEALIAKLRERLAKAEGLLREARSVLSRALPHTQQGLIARIDAAMEVRP